MNYYLFIDETGDHGLTTLNPDFPLFLLCGTLFPNSAYEQLSNEFNLIKQKLWGNKSVVFHSRDIRKCEKEFVVLFDLDKKQWFYQSINNVVENCDYVVFASAIKKDKYIKRFGKLSNDVYELALSFIIERAIFFLDEKNEDIKKLFIVIEKRGKKEDKKLSEHFQRLMARGTGYVGAERLKNYSLTIHFKDKKENVNGLQFADLAAYPIARFVIEPSRANPAFDVISKKLYCKNGKRYGLKIYP